MWPFATASRSSPAAAGSSANSAGWAIAKPMPISAVSARIAGIESTNASAATTGTWASETATINARFSKRSTISPATPASTTAGAHSAMNRPATARPEPPACWIASASATIARKSPAVETATEPTSRRRS